MSWAERMKEFGGGDFSFLSADGECIVFIVVGEPVLLKSTYKTKQNDRVGCPIVSDNGYTLLIGGKRLARQISKYEPLFTTQAIRVIRHGEQGDTDTTYEVKGVLEPETFNRLREIARTQVTPEVIAQSVLDAQETLDV